MERHKCKLCSRTFSNGRALGGHMKAHLATLPLPPKPQPLISFSYSSSSSSEDSEEEEEVVVTQRERESEEKALIYALRENPKKSFRLADPEFSALCSVVQDRESETESKNNNNSPTRQRSKRSKRNSKPIFPFSTEPEPVSSVSDPSPDEDIAMCLMMLSRDTRTNLRNAGLRSEQNHNCIKFKRVRGKNLCETCGKTFRSSRALGSHRSICCRDEQRNHDKIFQCPFCFKIFGSGQALGGHKRSHLVPSSSSTVNDSVRFKESFIDLNLPAPTEEDDLSVLSDA